MEKIEVRNHEQRIADFLADAEKLGISEDFLFVSTLERYATLVKIAERMQQEISESALTATKSYSAGTSNLYASPLLGEYNRTCASADRACALLSKLIETARKHADALAEDEEL